MRKVICAVALVVVSFFWAPGCRPSKLRVQAAPPASKIESKPEAPSLAHAWIPGEWTFEHAKEVWSWRAGYYAKKPDNAKSYRRGKWVQRGYSYLWTPGKWLF